MVEKIPTSLTLGEKEIPFSEINHRFSLKEWGVKLRKNVRYSRHKPEDISQRDWEKALGGDVNNLDHLIVTKGLTLSFLKGCDDSREKQKNTSEAINFSEKEKQILILTAIVHDWGEAIKGDIHFYDKRPEDNIAEMKELKIMIKKIFGEILENTGGADIQGVEDQVVDILTNTGSKLGRAFNVIERVGYVRTGINAYKRSETVKEELRVPLLNMGCRVVPGQLKVLLDYAKIYPPVYEYIKYHKNTIINIYADSERLGIQDTIPEFYGAREKWLSEISNF